MKRMSLRHVLVCMALSALSVALPLTESSAGSPHFPWHSKHSAHAQTPFGNVPVEVLSVPALSPVAALPSKQAYPYGWFGSNPVPQWKRSFGVSKAYTQWSRY